MHRGRVGAGHMGGACAVSFARCWRLLGWRDGGRGPFTPKERQGLFYSSEYQISSPSLNGDFGLGGNRYGTAHSLGNEQKEPPLSSRENQPNIANTRIGARVQRNSALDLLKRSVLIRELFRTTCETLKFLRSSDTSSSFVRDFPSI